MPLKEHIILNSRDMVCSFFCNSSIFAPSQKATSIKMNSPKLTSKGLHQRIRAIRATRNMSQEAIATKIGISQNAYSRIELGLAKLSIERMLKIADILEVSPIDLLTPDGGFQNQIDKKAAQSVQVLMDDLIAEKNAQIENLKRENEFLKEMLLKKK
jgi:transcriptional regulator with XRE-family HTH domain